MPHPLRNPARFTRPSHPHQLSHQALCRPPTTTGRRAACQTRGLALSTHVGSQNDRYAKAIFRLCSSLCLSNSTLVRLIGRQRSLQRRAESTFLLESAVCALFSEFRGSISICICICISISISISISNSNSELGTSNSNSKWGGCWERSFLLENAVCAQLLISAHLPRRALLNGVGTRAAGTRR